MRVIAFCCLVMLAAPGVLAQDPKPKPAGEDDRPDTSGKKTLKPLPRGQTRVFKAIVMEAVGAAQVRPQPGEGWQKVKKDDVYEPGATIRTGRKSHVALRVGPNATVLIERQSRVTVPEIVQVGATLKTRVDMAFGKMDVKVDRIGLRNDFGVSTPTATLAVRGTILRIIWTVIKGMQAYGVPGNKMAAILATYKTGLQAAISGGGTTEGTPSPWILQNFGVYFQPQQGAVGSEETLDDFSDTDYLNNPKTDTDQRAADKARGDKTQGGGDNPPPQRPPQDN